MGGTQSDFSEQELDDYQELTYFTKKEILHVYERYQQLAARESKSTSDCKTVRLKRDTILELPELKVNPFKKRITKVFSSSEDGDMTFEDFLDMMSVFSDNAPKNVKVEYAFRIYDFDEDDSISRDDLKDLVDCLTGEEQTLNDEEMEELTANIFEEADLDHDGSLSFAEFEYVISKTPDFVNSFRIRL